MARTIDTPIQQRFTDVDPFLHVNNVAQQMYFDVGKTDYYNKVLGGDVLMSGVRRIVTVSTSTSYEAQIRMYDDVHVTTVCERVGNKSMTLFQQLRVGGRVCSQSRSILVAFDFEAQQGIPVPDEWRIAMLKD
ncbi:MAG: thioesterase family protein [Alistipes sp.]|nr:thioesterase family protein [Alistipes sp.]